MSRFAIGWILAASACGGPNGPAVPDGAIPVDAEVLPPDAVPPDGGAILDAWAAALDAAPEPVAPDELLGPQIDLGVAAPVTLRGGSITFDPALVLPPAPPVPADGVSATNADLAADVTRAGTIRVVGSAVTSGDGDRRVITSTGGDIVVGGQLRTRGAHDLVLRAPGGTVFVTGVLDMRGAPRALVIEARAVVIVGEILAPGGELDLAVDEHARLTGTIDLRGGAGALTIESGGDVWLGGVVDGRDGAPLVLEGDALRILAPLRSRGGALAWDVDGDVAIATEIDLSGAPGAPGGTVTGRAPGEFGLALASTGALRLDGGDAIDGDAGHGGVIVIRTYDGDVSLAGRITARGGRAIVGAGGDGGRIDLFTDNDFDSHAGDLIVEPTGVIDMSGGAGVTGGDARNNGGAGVARFPEESEELAILLNTDGVIGPTDEGFLLNLGLVIARGGEPDGDGGDVMFHGRQEGIDEDPLPGAQDLSGAGDGDDGHFVAE